MKHTGIRHIAISLVLFLIASPQVSAEIDFDARLGLNIGAVTPIPIPEEIRSVGSYTYKFQPAVEFGARISLFGNTGIRTALRFEMKDMVACATVKNYKMTITGEDGKSLSGYWTGENNTNSRNVMLSVPLELFFKLPGRFRLHAGPYASVMITRQFLGEVFNGYLRENDPTGDKIAYYDGATSSYDFSEEMKRFQYGASATLDYDIGDWFLISASMNWGFTDIFKSSFETISFDMYPLFFNLSLGYRF